MNDKAVSVACLNLHYFVYVSKAVLKQAESCRTSARNRLMSIAVMADDTPEFAPSMAGYRRTSVTRMVQRRKSAMAYVDSSVMDESDNEQSMLSKQIPYIVQICSEGNIGISTAIFANILSNTNNLVS